MTDQATETSKPAEPTLEDRVKKLEQDLKFVKDSHSAHKASLKKQLGVE